DVAVGPKGPGLWGGGERGGPKGRRRVLGGGGGGPRRRRVPAEGGFHRLPRRSLQRARRESRRLPLCRARARRPAARRRRPLEGDGGGRERARLYGPQNPGVPRSSREQLLLRT